MMVASNAGFAISTGDIIIFLDADDYLFPSALDEIVNKWNENVAKIHFRLSKIQNGKEIGFSPPSSQKLSEGEVWREILKYGHYITSPTSGNAFSAKVLRTLSQE